MRGAHAARALVGRSTRGPHRTRREQHHQHRPRPGRRSTAPKRRAPPRHRNTPHQHQHGAPNRPSPRTPDRHTHHHHSTATRHRCAAGRRAAPGATALHVWRHIGGCSEGQDRGFGSRSGALTDQTRPNGGGRWGIWGEANCSSGWGGGAFPNPPTALPKNTPHSKATSNNPSHVWIVKKLNFTECVRWVRRAQIAQDWGVAQCITRTPLWDIPSGCCSFMGPRSPLRMLRRVAAFCRPLRPVLLLVSFPRSRSPVVGVPGLCWMWQDVPFVRQRCPVVGATMR